MSELLPALSSQNSELPNTPPRRVPTNSARITQLFRRSPRQRNCCSQRRRRLQRIGYPAAGPEAALADAMEQPGSGADHQARGCVVYIEDNASNVALIEDLLRDFEGTTLFTAPNAELGIALVLEHMPRLVIMDIHLPGMDGFEATARLKATPETRDIPVIALSAAPSSMASARAMQAGCYRYLSKPLNIVEFSKVLDRLLAPATSTDRPRARDDRRTE